MVETSFTMPERERLRRSSSLQSMPSWQSRRLLTNDDTLHKFTWTHGTAKLITELASIEEILNLAELVQQPTEMLGHFEISLSFEESFIDSHEMLVMLLDRVTEYWNTNAQQDTLDLYFRNNTNNTDTERPKTTDVILSSYKEANHIFKYTRENLLRMRSLFEQLQPETQDLIRRCTSKTQLQNSMLAQKAVDPTNLAAHLFMPACGYRLNSEKNVQSTKDRLHAVEMQLSRLQVEKDILVNKLHDEEVMSDALEVCVVLRNILAEGSTIQDQTEALKYATDIIAPQKHILERYSSSFENTLQAFPDVYPDTCTQEEASDFFIYMVEALEKDTKRLEMLKMQFV